jgi:hypothetical protein
MAPQPTPDPLGTLMNTLVCGPPCAGKSTWVRDNAPADAEVICYDTIAAEMGHAGPGSPPYILGRAAEAEVQRRIATLTPNTGAYIIRCMAGASRRAELAARIGAEVVLLVPPRDELARRAAQRPDPIKTMRDIDRWLATEAGRTGQRWTL